MIVGLGETGLSYARYLSSRGRRFVVADDNPGNSRVSDLRKIAADAELVSLDAKAMIDVTDVYLSPGVPVAHEVIQGAKARGARLHGDVAMFGELATAPIVAVTGTNGKSTVAKLVWEMASSQSEGVCLGGNIGTPCLDILDDDASLYVLEVSSYQLELAADLHTHIAVVLNLSPDHLDRYASVEDYFQTKLALYDHCSNAVLNRRLGSVPLPGKLAKTATFGSDQPAAESDFGLVEKEGRTWLARGNGASGVQWLMPADEVSLPGSHNLENILAALAVGWLLELDMQAMLASIRSFKGLPHRSELVAAADGVRFINDSKATNPGAMVAAVRGVAEGRNIHLIVGGESKGISFDGVAEQLKPFLAGVLVIGRDQSLMLDEFRELSPVGCRDLADAVSKAMQRASAGDVVLLSPGCASFDQYRDYQARGDAFRNAVQEVVS